MPFIPSPRSFNYDDAFKRSGQVVEEWTVSLREERVAAPLLFAELMRHTDEQREILVRNRRGFHTWGLFELLAERSREASIQDPSHGEALGRLALRIADFLPKDRYGGAPVEDLRARAWACIGNALRIRSDFREAEEAFQTAGKHLESGTEDIFEKASLLNLQASLRRDQRRHVDALKLLRRTVSLFQRLGDPHRAGRALINIASVYRSSGNPAQGIPLLQQALQLMDPDKEPRLQLCANHNLALYLAECDRVMESQRVYSKIKHVYEFFSDSLTEFRRKWLEAKIALSLGQHRRAESLFLTVREGFSAEGIPYDAALVSLDLALLYAEIGRMAELKRLSTEAIVIFSSRQVYQEELAARLLAGLS